MSGGMCSRCRILVQVKANRFVNRCDMSVPIGFDECIGLCTHRDLARFQMADKPPSTNNSTPFTKLESPEARNSATVAISSG
jgi:hypothetical protein